MQKKNNQARREWRNRVVATIQVAFDGVTRGEGISLRQACVAGDYFTTNALATDAGDSWPSLSAENIEKSPNVFPFLDPTGFRYYLPAYMCWVLKNYDRTTSVVVDWTIYALYPSEHKIVRNKDIEKYAVLNPMQRSATADFIKFMAYGPAAEYCDARSARKAHMTWMAFQ